MKYRKDKYERPLSILGFGCMRFTKKGRTIDLDKAREEVLEAYRHGVNYFDTAYVYPGNEAALGEILEETGIRSDVRIATKLPHYLITSSGGIERMFREELRRLRTTWIDNYLIHFLTDISQWQKLKKLGIEDWIREKKKADEIHSIGFSFHGNTENFLRILDDYDWDFCMIQYNYADEHAQAGREGLRAAATKGIPVIIMEPLRGGKLVDMLPEEAKALIRKSNLNFSPAELALRWLWDQPEVTCVLSGMNSVKMVRENCRIAEAAEIGAMPPEGYALIEQVRQIMTEKMQVGCTECGYCMPCPQGVDIPGNFRCYNRMYTESRRSGRKEWFQAIALGRPATFASQCNGCGRCERRCPQQIPIREKLKEADRALRPLPYRIAFSAARAIMLRGR
ncbi:MAG: aldo/keto reductase [Firmicutes bacterium]|nr:aldo/keto reductase [Bacillota bacterium]